MSGKSALIIDDSKSARFALRRYLEGHRYDVDAVESAEEAMRFLSGVKPGVIFLDHVMPGVDGFTVLKTLKSQPDTAGIPVVICSSNEGPQFNAQARISGAHCVLQKPPNPEILGRILKEIESGCSDAPMPKPVSPPATSAPSASPAVKEPPVLSLVSREPQQATNAHSVAGASLVQKTNVAPAKDAGDPGSGSEEVVRDQLETRMKKVSQGLFVQFAEIKATVAHLTSQQTRLAEQPANLRNEMRKRLDETSEALALVSSRIEGIEREVFSQLTAMRAHLDESLQSHSDRVNELAETARQAAAEEAQLVAERTVMSAAMRISDQLTDAIIGAAGRR